MQKRALGRTGLSIAPVVLGGNVFGWTVDEATSFSLLDAWLDAGLLDALPDEVRERACVMWLPGATSCVSHTLPPIVEPLPMVIRPRIVAPA